MRTLVYGEVLALVHQFMPAFAYPSLGQNLSISLPKREERLVWGALGDSWASGVSYNAFGETDYDNNKDSCLRINHAYSVKVSKAESWVPQGKTQNFHFVACSGSRLVNMVAEPFNGYRQLDAVEEPPTFITMQAGGNNAGFYGVASNCIFHDVLKDYGPDYPDPAGECAKAIEGSRTYIDNELYRQTQDTIKDVFNHRLVGKNPDFRLYSVGYAHFFNVEPDSWCNQASFVVQGIQRQPLNFALRMAINDLTERLNRKIEQAANEFPDDRARYIDITSGFDGARFCEPEHNLYDQYFKDKVKFWNVSPEGVIMRVDGRYSIREPTEEEFQKWRELGRFTDDPNEVTDEAQIEGSPTQDGKPGVVLRPLHPKENGHAVIAKAIIDRLKQDIRVTSPTQPPASHALTVTFENFITEIENSNYWTFFPTEVGKTIDACNTKPALSMQKGPGGHSSVDNPPFPNGAWNLSIFNQKCKYSSDGKGPGVLSCGNKEVQCMEHANKEGGQDKTQKCVPIAFGDNFHPVVYCEW